MNTNLLSTAPERLRIVFQDKDGCAGFGEMGCEASLTQIMHAVRQSSTVISL